MEELDHRRKGRLLASLRWRLRRFVLWVNRTTGYTEDQLRGGLQVSG